MIKSLNKALDVIECLSKKDCLTFTEICKNANLPNGTANRIIKTLMNRNFIEKDKINKKYYLGEKIFILGFLLFKNCNFGQIVRPILKEISDNTSETVNASILFENSVVFIDTVEGAYSVKMAAKIGHKNYINVSAAGKALAAFQEKNKIDEILLNARFPKLTKNTINNKKEFKKELERVYQNGYAVDNEEEEIGLKCIAGPVFDSNNKVVGAISISGPNTRIDNNFEKFKEEINKGCIKASKKLGNFIDYNKSIN